ncbi:hypothetical protein [Synechococcus sp. PROS-U-1]|uniref:hypothetical protein n=1 Tax=Synechococcus sp. PROS-U-1 TaxID=1400866 RepID=UPI0016481F05|nr:hypothetical protein [Synechococcus sp. PROS-U-1]QNJ04506.1 hypothetical protein SynPROSU1_02925 [Synechococcus sp. PROS-U-1]
MEKLVGVRRELWPPDPWPAGQGLNSPFDDSSSMGRSMVIRVLCRRTWLSALIRSVRREVLPDALRRRLIVVDLPKGV